VRRSQPPRRGAERSARRVFLLLVLLGPILLGSGEAAPIAVPSRGGPLPRLFPSSNWWNLDIRAAPIDPGSSDYIAFINNGTTRRLHPDFGGDAGGDEIYGFPFVVVGGNQPKRAVTFDYWDESDGVDYDTAAGLPFYPIPDQAITQPRWIEGGPPGNEDPGGDRHMLIVDRDNRFLYELFALRWNGSGWEAGSGAFFDLEKNDRRLDTWTSADAAGLAILPGLVRYDEVYGPGEIEHAFRVTLRASNGYVFPASHAAGSNPQALPMGARLRLKASKDISGFPEPIQKIFRAMKKYGLVMADNGSDLYISGAYDSRWDNDILNPAFAALTANDFEVIRLGYMPQVPSPLGVDRHSAAGTVSNENGVLEPGETVIVEPTWTYQGRAGATLTGAASSFTGPAGAAYSLDDAGASYGAVSGVVEGSGEARNCSTSTGNCYRLGVSSPPVRPALHWDASFAETLSTTGIKSWSLHVGRTFDDVPPEHPFSLAVETLLHAGVTGGCGPSTFCPSASITRAEMAVFLLKALHGPAWTPQPASGTVFSDVSAGSFAAAWIEELAREEITAGCGGGRFCPGTFVSRAQMAVFLLKALRGAWWMPAPASGSLFSDVSAGSFAAAWIEQLAREEITGGCGGGRFCPSASTTRGQMAVFLTKTFGLELYGP
jgi:hypothetical protein